MNEYRHDTAHDYTWIDNVDQVDLEALSTLYRLAPLGTKAPDALRTVFGHSKFAYFVYSGDAELVGAGRALADGLDCAYIADIAVHPAHQRRGLGAGIAAHLIRRCRRYKKIILYAAPGTEKFYERLGFLPMNTAMAIWHDPEAAIRSGLLSPVPGATRRTQTATQRAEGIEV